MKFMGNDRKKINELNKADKLKVKSKKDMNIGMEETNNSKIKMNVKL